jgi:2-polyprenyl-3-methyl-5-hydroxy-6-metoxy-1,4-benzoquinol methylase
MQDDKQFLGVLKSLCKPGGRVIVATPADPKIQDITEHVRGYDDAQIAELMMSVFPNFEVNKNARDYVVVGTV